MSNQNFKKNNKKIASLFITLVLLSSFSPLFARRTEAFFVDWVNFAVNSITSFTSNALWVKEYALDAVAGQVMNLVIQRVVASTVNWINSGFKGKPAFVTNPEAFFGNIGDQIAGQYIFDNPNLNFLCGPIRAKIKIALSDNYAGRREQRWVCTLSQVGRNLDDFMGDFEKGGWDNFFELTQRPQNNPIGAYIQAEGELLQRIANKTEEKKADLLQGRGFLSYKKCKRYAGSVTPSSGSSATTGTKKMVCAERAPLVAGDPKSGQCLKEVEVTVDSLGNEIPTQDIGPGIEGACIEEETLTPGDVISGQINQKLSFAGQKLVNADEINEIVSALLNQVVTRVVGTIGSGLSSLSKPDSSGQTFTTQLNPTKDQETKINEYFTVSGNTVDTINNLPPYDPNFCRNNPASAECTAPPGAPCDPNDSNCVAN